MSKALLAALERPITTFVTLDFETYYAADYSLSQKTMTTESYVRDPRFQVIGVGVKVGNRPSAWLTEYEFRRWAERVEWSHVALLCHHTHFDGFILSHHFGIHPGFMLDTLSMGRLLHGTEVGGSLDKLTQHYGVGAKGHAVHDFKGKRREDFTPQEWSTYGEYCVNDVELTLKLFSAMRPKVPELELWNIDTTVRMFTDPKLVVNEPKLHTFLAVEQARKAELLARVEKEPDLLRSNDKFAALLVDLGVEPPRKVSPKTGKEGYAFAKTDPGFKELLESDRDDVRWLAEARVGVKSNIDESRTVRFLKMGAGGRPFPIYLRYCGAHTHRWSGGDKVNLQNLRRGGELRESLEAPPGKRVVVVDSGQIEARMVSWLAGYREALAIFGDRKRDIYSEQGTKFFGRKVSKEETPDLRQVSKSMVLGLGFQMGKARFSGELLKGMLGTAPKQFTRSDALALGVDIERFKSSDWCMTNIVGKVISRVKGEALVIHCAVASELVDRYRHEAAAIVDFWGKCEEMLVCMANGYGERFGPNGCIQTKENALELPNGTVLRYPGLEMREDAEGEQFPGFSYMGAKHGKARSHIYGGLLCENITQKMARDVVAEQMLRIRVRYPEVVTMTHDEVVFLAPEAEADAALEYAYECMRTAPEWCADLPLNVEGGHGKSYGEAK